MALRNDPELQHIANELGTLETYEIWWRDHYHWLLECGYQLRPRYDPGWIPSWMETMKNPLLSQDSATPYFPHLLDAVRVADDAQVALKKIDKSIHPFEIDIGQLFSSEPMALDPWNHCIPFLSVLQVPDDDNMVIIVMPLCLDYDEPEFETIGEAVDFFRQIFQGLQFMHEHRVAHRDCNAGNIVMDAKAVAPRGFYYLDPKQSRYGDGPSKLVPRTKSRPKYYFVDFGISRRYGPEVEAPLEPVIHGGDRTVPEFKDPRIPQDPFPTDVYYLGNLIRTEFIEGNPLLVGVEGRLGFDFMQPLINDMVQGDPTKRPKMNEVVERFEALVRDLSPLKLRSRVVPRSQKGLSWLQIKAMEIGHWRTQVSHFVTCTSPVPSAPQERTLRWSLSSFK